MDKDLVQVYFSNSEVWIVGNRTWNGPYRVSGTPTILSLPIDPTLLGETICNLLSFNQCLAHKSRFLYRAV